MMSTTKQFSTVLFALLVITTICCCQIYAMPTLHSKDKGVTLPIAPSVVNKSWCRSAMFKERIVEPGCEPKLVYNRFCYGQCISFFVPRYPLDNFRSCTACAPAVMEKRVIRLKCPRSKTPVQLKEIMLVKSCHCRLDFFDTTKGKKGL